MTKDQLNTNFDKLFSDWNNKYITVLNPGRQCFDVSVKFTDMLGVPHYAGNPSPFPYANAYEIYTKYGSFQAQWFDRVENTPTYVPIKGDIMVWGGAYNGGIGHTGVATGKGDTNAFECFEQNDPLGSVTHLRTYNYNYVLGCLRLKITQPVPTPTPLPDYLAHYTLGWKDIALLHGLDINSPMFVDYRNIDTLIADQKKPLQEQIVTLKNQVLSTRKSTIQECIGALNKL